MLDETYGLQITFSEYLKFSQMPNELDNIGHQTKNERKTGMIHTHVFSLSLNDFSSSSTSLASSSSDVIDKSLDLQIFKRY